MVTISRRDAKKGFLGMGADGIYTFPYAGLGNAQLFLSMLSIASKMTETQEESAAHSAPAA